MGRGGKGLEGVGRSREGVGRSGKRWEGGWRVEHTLVVVGCVDKVTLYLYIKL